MLSTAVQLLEATKSSIFDEDVMHMAGELHERRNDLPDEIFAKYLYAYSTAIASKVADRVTQILLTEQEMSDLCNIMDEMSDLSETVLEENE